MERFDLVVIGGGPAGITAALRAAELGARVAARRAGPARRHVHGRRLRADPGAREGRAPAARRRTAARVRACRRGPASVDLSALLAATQRTVYELHEKKQLIGHLARAGVTLVAGRGSVRLRRRTGRGIGERRGSSRQTASSSRPGATPGACRFRAASWRSRIPTCGRCGRSRARWRSSAPRPPGRSWRRSSRPSARRSRCWSSHRGSCRARTLTSPPRSPRPSRPMASTSSPASPGSTRSRASGGGLRLAYRTGDGPAVLDVASVMLAVGWPGEPRRPPPRCGRRGDGSRVRQGRRPAPDLRPARLGRRRYHRPDDARPERDLRGTDRRRERRRRGPGAICGT